MTKQHYSCDTHEEMNLVQFTVISIPHASTMKYVECNTVNFGKARKFSSGLSSQSSSSIGVLLLVSIP